jgi:hypothetical protein
VVRRAAVVGEAEERRPGERPRLAFGADDGPVLDGRSIAGRDGLAEADVRRLFVAERL